MPSNRKAVLGSAAKPLAAAQVLRGPFVRLQEMLPPAAPATAAASAVATAEAAAVAAGWMFLYVLLPLLW